MLSAVGILVWEQGRNSAKGLSVVFLFLVLYGAALYLVRDLVTTIFTGVQFALFASYLPVLGAVVLLFLHENRGQIGFTYPRRMLILPVPTSALLLAPLLFKCVVVAAYATLAGLMCKYFLLEYYTVWPMVVVFMVIVAVLQALVFLSLGYGGAPSWGFSLLALLLSVPALGLVFGAAGKAFSAVDIVRLISQEKRVPPPEPPEVVGPMLAGIILLVFWSILAYLGARRARREVPLDQGRALTGLINRVTYLEGERTAFATPQAAQRWYEWRRGGYLFPWSVAAAGFLLMLLFRSDVGGSEERFLLTVNLLGLSPILVAATVGYILTRKDEPYLWFVCCKPLSTRGVVRARLKTGLRAIAVGYGMMLTAWIAAQFILFPGTPIFSTLFRDLQDITHISASSGESIGLVAFFLALSVLTSWSLLWIGRLAGVAIWGAGLIAAINYFFVREIWVEDGGVFHSPVLNAYLIAVSLLAAVGIALATGICVKKQLFPTPKAAAFAVCLIPVLFGAYYFREFLPSGRFPIIALWMIIPFAPLATLPLTIDFQRHR